MKKGVLSTIIATGFDSHDNKHPAAFLPPPPPSFSGHSTTSYWLNIWMEKDGCLVKKKKKKQVHKHDVNQKKTDTPFANVPEECCLS